LDVVFGVYQSIPGRLHPVMLQMHPHQDKPAYAFGEGAESPCQVRRWLVLSLDCLFAVLFDSLDKSAEKRYGRFLAR
jgi:hypothetical protein